MCIAHGRGYHFLSYAIMPNHVHRVVRVPEGGAINTVLANGKRSMAYALVQRGSAVGRRHLLARLREGLHPSDVARGPKHRVFATSTDLVELRSGVMVEQKLQYV